jgi:small subunit ribosomal protein S15
LDSHIKANVINEFKLHEGDTGSAEVQIAVLTARIKQLTQHMAVHSHDNHTKRAMLTLIGHRRRLLAYLNNEDVTRYKSLIERLGLRK